MLRIFFWAKAPHDQSELKFSKNKKISTQIILAKDNATQSTNKIRSMRCPNYLFWTLSSACSGEEALGLESGLITDQQITASSSWDTAHGKQNARLNRQAARGKTSAWSAGSNDLNQWLQIDFGRNVKITKLATQGRKDWGDQWVKSYTLAYSAEGSNVFQAYQENESDKVQWFP